MSRAYDLKEHTLPNGLIVQTIRQPHLHSTTVSVYARVGSRHEAPTDNGLSHFLEHMFFRGSGTFPDSTALNAAMEDLGGILDGFTTRDYSGYQSTVHPSTVEDAIGIFADMFTSPRFDDIDIERSIILEEQLDALDDRGRDLDLDNLVHKAAFGDHPLSQTVDGPRKNLKRFDHDDLHRHRERFYGAKNLVLTVAGKLEHDQIRRIARKAFRPLFEGQQAKEGRPPVMPAKSPKVRFVSSDDAQTRIRIVFRTVPSTHRDYPALLLIRRILDGGLSARLQVELVEKRGIVYEVGADHETYVDCGLFGFELAVAHRKLAYAITELARVLIDLRTDGVQAHELDRVRARSRIGLELGLDAPAELAQWFGPTRLFHPPTTPETRMDELDAVTITDMRRVIKKYLKPERMTVVGVGGANKTQIAEARKALKEMASQLVQR
ncbi:MAG: pitrilysin family protein [Myxococcota bacterium]